MFSQWSEREGEVTHLIRVGFGCAVVPHVWLALVGGVGAAKGREEGRTGEWGCCAVAK